MEPKIVSKYEDLIAILESFTDQAVITIDGVDGCGKTTLVEKLSKDLSVSFISLDKHLKQYKNGYIDFIKYDELSKKISDGVPIVLVEGVCILEVMKRLKIVPDLTIYYRVLGSFDFWDHRLKYFPIDKTADQVIQQREYADDSLKVDIVKYHYGYKPWKTAGIVYERKSP